MFGYAKKGFPMSTMGYESTGFVMEHHWLLNLISFHFILFYLISSYLLFLLFFVLSFALFVCLSFYLFICVCSFFFFFLTYKHFTILHANAFILWDF